ncbi:hypothetical protein CH253_08405 [Rhodococcus sp. 06-156-3C]|uniref:tyrosine-type recombinase/integrase n=1 Tax=Rhodococcus sp. 06-156-3C TaxID=2022486 RepID=UPI000B9A55BE|nr:site-specific integrase [Rhodococcus sp. 06-156-3C]OZD23868.1 hypothetical protein CH253_08405 [Rhodococcus sp. 06-156-3C]
MAWAEQLPSGKYRGLYRTPDGSKRSVGTYSHKKQAVTAATLKEVEASKAANPTQAMTWAEWEPLWWAGRMVGQSTLTRNKGAIDHHIRPRWGAVQLDQITHDDVQNWVALMVKPKKDGGAGVAANTAIKNLMILSGSLKAATIKGLIPKNPCTGIKQPKPGVMPERFLTDAETVALRKAIPQGIMQLFYDVALGTGMRIGEVQGLHWQSVDLDNHTVTVEWSWDRVSRFMKPPKDEESRIIPIGPTLSAALADYLDQVGYGTPAPCEYIKGTKPHTGLVFAYVENRPLDDAKIRALFGAAVRVTNVGAGAKRKHIGHVRLGDLRHTYASRLVAQGIPLQQVQYLLGHASITTTERYAKLAQQWWKDVRKVQG